MAEDTIAYLEQELSRPAHLVGWSDGAVVGLLVAQRRPDLVERLVLISQYYNSTGKVAGSMLAQLLASASEAMQFLRGEYDTVSPDGAEHFPVVYAKTMQMINTEPEIDLDTLTRIQSPTLVLQGDQDEVTVAHSMAVVDALPHGRLAVLPEPMLCRSNPLNRSTRFSSRSCAEGRNPRDGVPDRQFPLASLGRRPLGMGRTGTASRAGRSPRG